MEPSSHVYSAKIGPHNSLCGDGFDADQTAGGFATGSGARVIDGIGCSSLSAGSRQAGGGASSALSGAAAEAPAAGRLAAAIATIRAIRRPIRDGAERSKELNFRISQSRFCASRNHRSAKGSAEEKDGPAREACRGRGENSNAPIVRAASGSGFVAAAGPATVEIFSPEIPRDARCAGPNLYVGANPTDRSKRLA